MNDSNKLEWDEEEKCIRVEINENELPRCMRDDHMFQESIHGDLKFYLCMLCGKSYYENIKEKK
jgi:uncharacterized pyridoxamine 5'-phosphate oxidase family protein